MGRETTLFRSKEKMSNKEAAELMRLLADKIEQGKVSLSKGNDTLKIKVPGRVEVQVKAEKEVGKNKTQKKLEVEIQWLVGESAKGCGPLIVK